jgi:hypothetical protein
LENVPPVPRIVSSRRSLLKTMFGGRGGGCAELAITTSKAAANRGIRLVEPIRVYLNPSVADLEGTYWSTSLMSLSRSDGTNLVFPYSLIKALVSAVTNSESSI